MRSIFCCLLASVQLTPAVCDTTGSSCEPAAMSANWRAAPAGGTASQNGRLWASHVPRGLQKLRTSDANALDQPTRQQLIEELEAVFPQSVLSSHLFYLHLVHRIETPYDWHYDREQSRTVSRSVSLNDNVLLYRINTLPDTGKRHRLQYILGQLGHGVAHLDIPPLPAPETGLKPEHGRPTDPRLAARAVDPRLAKAHPSDPRLSRALQARHDRSTTETGPLSPMEQKLAKYAEKATQTAPRATASHSTQTSQTAEPTATTRKTHAALPPQAALATRAIQAPQYPSQDKPLPVLKKLSVCVPGIDSMEAPTSEITKLGGCKLEALAKCHSETGNPFKLDDTQLEIMQNTQRIVNKNTSVFISLNVVHSDRIVSGIELAIFNPAKVTTKEDLKILSAHLSIQKYQVKPSHSPSHGSCISIGIKNAIHVVQSFIDHYFIDYPVSKGVDCYLVSHSLPSLNDDIKVLEAIGLRLPTLSRLNVVFTQCLLNDSLNTTPSLFDMAVASGIDCYGLRDSSGDAYVTLLSLLKLSDPELRREKGLDNSSFSIADLEQEVEERRKRRKLSENSLDANPKFLTNCFTALKEITRPWFSSNSSAVSTSYLPPSNKRIDLPLKMEPVRVSPLEIVPRIERGFCVSKNDLVKEGNARLEELNLYFKHIGNPLHLDTHVLGPLRYVLRTVSKLSKVLLSITCKVVNPGLIYDFGICIVDPYNMDKKTGKMRLDSIRVVGLAETMEHNEYSHPSSFVQGPSVILPISEAAKLVQCLIDYYSVEVYNTRGLGCYIVGHDVPFQTSNLKQLGILLPERLLCPPTHLGKDPLESLDVKTLFGYLHKAPKPLPHIISACGSFYEGDCNAGNQAYYAMVALLLMADPGVRQHQGLDTGDHLDAVTQYKPYGQDYRKRKGKKPPLLAYSNYKDALRVIFEEEKVPTKDEELDY